MTSRQISEKTAKIVWARAGGMCSYPGCFKSLIIAPKTPGDPHAVLGEIVHIVGQSEDGPRGKDLFCGNDRNSPENLLLLCADHHMLIDQQINAYPTAQLYRMKESHERWIRERLLPDRHGFQPPNYLTKGKQDSLLEKEYEEFEVDSMPNPNYSKQNRSQKTRGGVHAQTGFLFQNQVAARLAVRMLLEQDVSPFWDLPVTTTLKKLSFEITEPVDDLLAYTSTDGFIFILIKHSLPFTSQPASGFARCLDLFVHQFLLFSGLLGNTGISRRPLDASKDRLLLIIGPDSSLQFQSLLPRVLRKLRALSPQQAMFDVVADENEHRVLCVVYTCIQRSWQELMHIAPSDEEIREILSFIYLEVFDANPGSATEQEIFDLLGTIVHYDPFQAQDLWHTLIYICTELAARQESSVDRASLLKRIPSLDISPIEILYCYARKDEKLRDELAQHLEPLKRERKITTWYDRQIELGMDWNHEINVHLNTAHIILLLISSHFLASNYCYGVEMQQALRRHQAGEVRVIPIILEPVDWQNTPLGVLQASPLDGKPITMWRNRQRAFLDVVQGIRQVMNTLLQKTGESRHPID